MRVVFGLVGLVLSVIAIGACDEPHYKDADAATCMAYLSLQSAAVSEGRMSGDVVALDSAAAAWRSLAEQKYPAAELAEYFAGSVAAFDDIAVSDWELISAACLRRAPV